MSFQAKNILVTGGLGFIGSNFIHHAQKRWPQARFINLDLQTYAASFANVENLPDPMRYEFVKGDIADTALIIKLLTEKNIDTIVHFAAESHVDRSISGPAPFIHSNIVGTFSLLEAARQVWLQQKQWTAEQCRFHHVSTDEVYGTLTATDPAFTETTAYAPNSPYAASKAGSDHLVHAYHITYGLPMTLSNCSNNYGPRQHAEKFIPTVVRSCVNQTAIPIYGNGSNIRDWLYVDDHCDAIGVIIEQGRLGESYNIGGENEWANIDVAKVICQIFDELKPEAAPHSKLLNFVQDRLGHDWRYAINSHKISSELAWHPQETFETGIRKTILALVS